MKRISIFPVLAILLLLVAPTLAQDEPQPVTFFFHSGTGGEFDAVTQITENFNNSQDEFVAIPTEIPGENYTDAVNAAALAGDLPCLLDFDGPTLYSFAWRGYLTPIDDLIPEGFLDDILPSIVQQGTYNDQLYSLGVFDSGLAIWGNRAYLEEAGVRIPTSIEDAWTFDEFNAAIEALSALDGVYALDFKTNYGAGEWYTYGLSPILQSFGADLIERDAFQEAEGTLNGAEAVEALEWFSGLFENGHALTSPPDDSEFVNGNAALSWVGHWEYPNYLQNLEDDLVLIPMPQLGDAAVTGMGSWNWGITSSCENPEGAWAFLEFMLEADQMQIMTNANGAVPSRISVLEADERYAEGGPLNIYFQQLTSGVAVPRPATPAYPVITAEFARAVDEILKGADVQGALDTAVDAIERDIAENDGYPLD